MKIKEMPVWAVIASVIILFVSNQATSSKLTKVQVALFDKGIKTKLQGNYEPGPIHYPLWSTAQERLSQKNNSFGSPEFLNTHFRFRAREFTKLDESYRYQSSQSIKDDYQSWALEVRQRYPDISQRVKYYATAIQQHPQNRLLLADYVTLLSWDKQYRTAVSFYRDRLQQQSNLPAYALNAVALSAREVGDYDYSRDLYNKTLKRTPNHTQSLLGLSVVDMRQKRYSVAETRIKKVLSQHPENREALELLAFLYNQQQGKELEKIQVYDQLISPAAKSDQQELGRLRTLNLLEMGAIEIAASEMEKHPQSYRDTDWLKLRSLQNTKAIRRVTGAGQSIDKPAFVEQAFEYNQQYINLLQQASPSSQQLLAVAYADRILLFNTLSRHADAIGIANQQSALVNRLPGYGLIALANSYQASALPRQSLTIIREGFASKQIAANEEGALKVGYYAALDCGNIKLAEHYLNRLIEQQPQWRYSQDHSRRKANTDYGDVALMQAMHKAFVNDLAGAEASLRGLIKSAPQNNEYRYNLANVLRWRGFINQSNHQLGIIKATDPKYTPSQISHVYNLLAHRQFDQARLSLYELKQERASDSLTRLAQDYAIQVDPRLELSISGGNSDGSNFSSKDRNYRAKVYSRLYDDSWRAFASVQNYRSNFFQLNETTATQGLGVSYVTQWFNAELELYDVDEFDGVEFSGSYQWFLEDYITLELRHQTFNKNTPVRAVFSGIDSDLNSIKLNYRHDERQNYSASWQWSSFSDGNDRNSFSMTGSQVLYHDYNQRLTASEFIYSERNSLDTERLYFNPDSALGVSVSLSYEEMLYKHANRNLWHGLKVEYGIYDQEGFERGDIGSVSYFHQWQLNRRSYLNYSIGYNRRLYDGLTETGPVYSLSYGVTF
ncbi:poly-beta-1,6 N-acetyl-D-glucosamine export porin PgaA [Kangiella shandongensis]|uniref:poly-beta-1,6 N-acetyl-D-glucosamine export porin PgaA n=1 Tax=Kangiella shandongensis TaxID=2763258 RepID=UPI001CBFCC51|nr:poly-beta-1,6 N-acetyl-D-glucosamine export porin PgaA [Kangiella shandongensis]